MLTWVGFPLCRYVFPWFFHVSQRFLLLGVHRHRRFTVPLTDTDPFGNVVKMRIPVRMLLAFHRLTIRLQTVALAAEQPTTDFGTADGSVPWQAFECFCTSIATATSGPLAPWSQPGSPRHLSVWAVRLPGGDVRPQASFADSRPTPPDHQALESQSESSGPKAPWPEPPPNDRASAAAQRRLPRSSKSVRTATYFSRIH